MTGRVMSEAETNISNAETGDATGASYSVDANNNIALTWRT